ncbi:MAG: hypothetical protein ACI4SC_01020 [Candidatus Neoclostridium sp.]
MSEVMKIGCSVQMLFDDYLVDGEKTTAPVVQKSPERRNKIADFDAPWDNDSICYMQAIKLAENDYRLYYRTTKTDDAGILHGMICVLFSRDGVDWFRPELGLYEFNGSKRNNIVTDRPEGEMHALDNFTVFYDENPRCKRGERFKAVSQCQVMNPGGKGYFDFENYLGAFTSEDGLSFSPAGYIMKGWHWDDEEYKNSENGVLGFDSQNLCFWDKDKNCYVLFVRGFHDVVYTEDGTEKTLPRVRDFRVLYSDDFKNWTKPQIVNVSKPVYPLYISNVNKYKGIYVGIPVRYCERSEWDDSFEQLCAKQRRKLVMQGEKRSGLALTDCTLMYSRGDLTHFTKTDRPFLTPGPEHNNNWFYGNCYVSHGIIQTKAPFEGADDELSFFATENYRSGVNCTVYRYVLRQEGFFARTGDFQGKKVVTKPFVLEGDRLFINFASSACGGVAVTVKETESGEELKSCRHFGNRVRRLVFADLKRFVGKVVTMEFDLIDSELYSFVVEKSDTDKPQGEEK